MELNRDGGIASVITVHITYFTMCLNVCSKLLVDRRHNFLMLFFLLILLAIVLSSKSFNLKKKVISRNKKDVSTVVETLYCSPVVSLGEHCDNVGITFDFLEKIIDIGQLPDGWYEVKITNRVALEIFHYKEKKSLSVFHLKK